MADVQACPGSDTFMIMSILFVGFNFPPTAKRGDAERHLAWLRATRDVVQCKDCRATFSAALQAFAKGGAPGDRRRFSKMCFELAKSLHTSGCCSRVHLSWMDTFEACASTFEQFRAPSDSESNAPRQKSNKKPKLCTRVLRGTTAGVVVDDACRAAACTTHCRENVVEDSKEGFTTTVWGPIFWEMIHNISFSYPEKPTQADVEAHAKWTEAIGKVLPCRACRTHFPSRLIDAGYADPAYRALALSSRRNCVRMWYQIHSAVNRPRRYAFQDLLARAPSGTCASVVIAPAHSLKV